jgi:2-phospho-L-lactate/phosphoenolpyruvate guanylyltransferase
LTVHYRGDMQGTVASFDAASHSGTVVLDDGLRLGFDAEVFARSGARLLRPGQRVFLEIDDSGSIPGINAMWLFHPNSPSGGTATS